MGQYPPVRPAESTVHYPTGMSIEMTMDVRGLERLIPELVAYGRRTVVEQCVTSLGMILQSAQNWTPYVDLGRMDAELEVVDHLSGPSTNFGKAAGLGGLVWTEAMMIAVQRTNPNSPFSLETGNRWPLAYAGGLRGAARWRFFQDAADRMQSARHSSAHFLRAGYAAARDACVSSPYYKNRYRARGASSGLNPLNTLSPERLGGTVIDLVGDQCVVTSMNNVGELGNPVLDAKHRAALIKYSAPALQDSVDAEAAACQAELDRRMAEKWPIFNQMLGV